MRITVNSVCHTVLIQIANKKVLCDSTCLIVMTFQCTVIKYRSQIVLPACPGDLPACPPKRTKVKGKCAGVPYIYILQPVDTGEDFSNSVDGCDGGKDNEN